MQVRSGCSCRCRFGLPPSFPCSVLPLGKANVARGVDAVHAAPFSFSRAASGTQRGRCARVRTNHSGREDRVYRRENHAVLLRRAFSTSGHWPRTTQRQGSLQASSARRASAARINAAVDRLTSNIHDISDMSPHVLTAAATTAAKRGLKGHWAACVARAFDLRRGLSVRDAALLFSATARMRAQDARFLDMLADVLLAKFQKARDQQALLEQLREQQQRQRRRDSSRAEASLPASRSRPTQPRALSPSCSGPCDASVSEAPSDAPAGAFSSSFSRSLSPGPSQSSAGSFPPSPTPGSPASSRLAAPLAPSSLCPSADAAVPVTDPPRAAFSPFAIYSVAVACASLRYFNEALLTALATSAAHVPLSAFSGFDLVGLLASFASLNFVPPAPFLREAHALLGEEMRLWNSRVQRTLRLEGAGPPPLERRDCTDSRAGLGTLGGMGAVGSAASQSRQISLRRQSQDFPDGGCRKGGADREPSSLPQTGSGNRPDAAGKSGETEEPQEGDALPRDLSSRELPIAEAVTHGNLADRQTVNVASVLHSMAQFAEKSEERSAPGRETGRGFRRAPRSEDADPKRQRRGLEVGGDEQAAFFSACLSLIRTHLAAHLRSAPVPQVGLPFSGRAASGTSAAAAEKVQTWAHETNPLTDASRPVDLDPQPRRACPRYNFAFSLTSLRDVSAIASVLNFLPSLEVYSALKEAQAPPEPSSSVVHAILADLALLAPRIAERTGNPEAAPVTVGLAARTTSANRHSSVASPVPAVSTDASSAPQRDVRLGPSESPLGPGQVVPGCPRALASRVGVRPSSSPATFLSLLAIARAHSRLHPPIRPPVPLLSCCLREMQRHPSLLTATRFVGLWRVFSSVCPRSEELARLRSSPAGRATWEAPRPRGEMSEASAEIGPSFLDETPSSLLFADQDTARVAALGRTAFAFLCQHSERLIFACTLPQLASVASSLLAFEPLFKTADGRDESRRVYAVQATSIADAIRRRLLQLYRMQERTVGATVQGDAERAGSGLEGDSSTESGDVEATTHAGQSRASTDLPEAISWTARANCAAPGELLQRPQQVVWLLGVLGRFTPESGQYAALPLLTALCSGVGDACKTPAIRIFPQPSSSRKESLPKAGAVSELGVDGRPERANATETLPRVCVSPWVLGLSAQEVAVLLRAMARLHLRYTPLLTQLGFHLSALFDNSREGIGRKAGQRSTREGRPEAQPPQGTAAAAVPPVDRPEPAVQDDAREEKLTAGDRGPHSELWSAAHDAHGFTSGSPSSASVPSSPPLASGHASSSSLASILLALAKLAFHPFFLSGSPHRGPASSCAPVCGTNGLPLSVSQLRDASRSSPRGTDPSQTEPHCRSQDAAAALAWTAVLRRLSLRCAARPWVESSESQSPARSEGRSAEGLGIQRDMSATRSHRDDDLEQADKEVTLFTAVNALYALALVDFKECCVGDNVQQTTQMRERFGEQGARQSSSSGCCKDATRLSGETARVSLTSEALAALTQVCKRNWFTRGQRDLRTTPSPDKKEGEGSDREEAHFGGPPSGAEEVKTFEMDRLGGRGESGAFEVFGQLIAVHASLERLRAGDARGVGTPDGSAVPQPFGVPPRALQQRVASAQTMETLKLARDRGEDALRMGHAPSPATLATSAFHRHAMMALEAALPEEKLLTEVAIEFDGPMHFYHPASYSRSNARRSHLGSEADGGVHADARGSGNFGRDRKVAADSVNGGAGSSSRERVRRSTGDAGRQACDAGDKNMSHSQNRWREVRSAQYTSLSLFKQRLLERHGFRVVRVAYSDWMRLDGDLERQKHFLLRKIDAALD
ncbi:conserved hypothetical protein [Neospora caninum Liverpool]|uniref:RAP domain-containing protein n=1 Tax=Neospora caninum (strain Liverpool) TaxID=572307 RepID=F0VFI2_NEOCL|nr:conserved hypothetical protein [Neospora caninum Liverpool]CBZ52476.1 conserved hypothetical protein [Neospora caninum Liverpool]|eukprot:XP_003882508.1 conserved hypothetical protein [Neospora caninum Liverpool]